jgi:hypothetical protein
MTTLHIEVTVNDIDAFRAGFAQHREARRQAGVRAERVRHPIGDPFHLIVDLDFDTVPQAEAFLGFLREVIWKESPAVVGAPRGSILESLEQLSTLA